MIGEIVRGRDVVETEEGNDKKEKRKSNERRMIRLPLSLDENKVAQPLTILSSDRLQSEIAEMTASMGMESGQSAGS